MPCMDKTDSARLGWKSALALVNDEDRVEEQRTTLLRDDLDATTRPIVKIKSFDEISKPSNPFSKSDANPPSDEGKAGKSQTKFKYVSSESSRRAANRDVVMSSSMPSRTFGTVSIEELTKKQRTDRNITAQKRDLNGINPFLPLGSSILSAGMSYGTWQVTIYLAQHFAIQFISSENYPVQRLAMVGRNVIVGIFSLFAGFCGMVSIGLLMLAVAVGIGILKGELNPSSKPLLFDDRKSESTANTEL